MGQTIIAAPPVASPQQFFVLYDKFFTKPRLTDRETSIISRLTLQPSIHTMTRSSLQPPSSLTVTALATAAFAGGLLCAPAIASPEAGDGVLSPWPTSAENHCAAEFLATALPVASNKSDLDNSAAGFFRTPAPTAHEPGTILYVGLRAEPTPTSGPYRSPLFSGSIESFDLGISGAQPALQTVGDIGEIFAEDAPPTPMSYIVYRLDFSTHGNDAVALFATPNVTIEPFTTRAPDALDANFAWESISFSDFGLEVQQERDLEANHNATSNRSKMSSAPEPASAVLLSLGLIAFGLRRRQRAC